MLNFEVKLSAQAVQLLFYLIEWNKTDEYKVLMASDYTKKSFECINKWAEVVKHEQFRALVVQARQLERNGLLEHHNKDSWTVTEKGYLLAQLIQLEMKEVQGINEVAKQMFGVKQQELNK